MNATTLASTLVTQFNESSRPANSWLAAAECRPKLEGDRLEQEAEEQRLYVNLSSLWYCFLALITAIGLLISLISNMIIIYLFTSTPLLRKNPSNVIAVNLSLSDLLYCVQWPSVIYCSLTQSTWILEYSFVCQSFGFITVSTALASILTVLAMSIERAIVIVYSIQAKNKFSIRLAWLINVLIWVVSLSSCLPPLFGKFNRYTLDPSKTSCTLDYLSHHSNYKLYILVLYVAYWILPTILISISYITIIVTFKKSSLDLKKISSVDSDTYASSTSLFTVRCLGRQIRDSLRLKSSLSSTSSSSRRHPNRAGSQRFGCPFERRASASVVDLSSYLGASNPSSTQQVAESTRDGPRKTVAGNNPKRTFKRVVSSSALPSCTMTPSQHQFADTDKSHGVANMAQVGGSIRRGARTTTSSMKHTETNNRLRFSLVKTSHMTAGGSFRPRIIKTISNLKAFPQHAASSQLTRAVLQFRLAKMSFYLILLWLVSWTPIASLAMINSVMKCPRVSATAVFLASTMTKLGPALDVFIYGISHPKIKSKFKLIIGKLLFLNGLCSNASMVKIRQDRQSNWTTSSQ